MKLIQQTLLVVGVMIGMLGLSTVIATPKTRAVEILNNCSATSTTAAQKSGCTDCSSTVGQSTDYCKEADQQKANGNPVVSLIKTIINLISYIAGAAAVISLIVFGLRMVLSNGDSQSAANSRNGIIYALIGIVVIIMAQLIVVFILNRIE